MGCLSGDETQADLGPQLKNWAAQNRSQEAVLGFSHSLGHKETFMVNQKHACPVCGQLGVLHGTIPRLFTDWLWRNRLT